MISRAYLTVCIGLALPLVVAFTEAGLKARTTEAAADLRPQTVAAFDRYVAETERQREQSLTNPSPFLWIEAQRPEQRVSLEQLRAGAFVIERLTTNTSDGKKIEAPDGLIHHWLGAVFVPGASLDQAIALLQDYDRHATIYAPAVAQSKVLSRDGDSFRVSLRFFMKKIITVVVDGEHQARFTRLALDRAHSRVVSTRLNEVEDPGTDRERLKPEGRDGGYLWRINSYWRFLERDGGTYIQCETITLSRRIPAGLGWLVGPFVTSIPKDSLEFTLTTTRQTLAATVKAGGGRPR
jgi:hypothetical protein